MRFFQICSFLNMLNHLDIFCNHLVFTCSSPYISMVCMYVIFIYSRCLQIYIFKIIMYVCMYVCMYACMYVCM